MIRLERKLKPKPQLIDLTPLVDVIFLLLIFFLATSEILPMKSLLVENPSLNEQAQSRLAQVVVIMDRDHVIYVGSKRSIVDMPSVAQELKENIRYLQQKKPHTVPTIFVSVDKTVDYATFLRLFSQVQQCQCPIRLAFKPEYEHTEEVL